MTFDFPAICFARNTMLNVKTAKTILRTKLFKALTLQDCLFIASTTAWLSEKNMTLLFCKCFPHNSYATTIGNNSVIAI